MILSHQSIKEIIKKEGIIRNYTEESIRENGYDLRICGEKYYEVEGNSALPEKKSEIKEIDFKDYAAFYPCKTYLFETCEEFHMPGDLAALITLRSTLARNGFLLPPTIIDAGYEGKITLALSSLYQNKIMRETRVAHVIFLKLDKPTEKSYNGKYQGGIII
ncbi:dCTP deaminase [Acidianus sp. HS-5]|uniref:dCTP deaminase n=1 Tax=Acidianus sp. HS-5 TaxID=2886040 RepID=UPI001F01EB68|nr:dCTP deaminase [Acidianus sp. HS-5]BDC18056.1 deoxycytidine triphosphate deaminase [Acidianus sp. HS-5]